MGTAIHVPGLPADGSPKQILALNEDGVPIWSTGQVRLGAGTLNFGNLIRSITPITLSFGIDVTFLFFVAVVVTKATGSFVGLEIPITNVALDGLVLTGDSLPDSHTVAGLATAIQVFGSQDNLDPYVPTGDEETTPGIAATASGSVDAANGLTVTGLFPLSFGRATIELPSDTDEGELDLSFCYVAKIAQLDPSTPDADAYLADTQATLTLKIVGLTT